MAIIKKIPEEDEDISQEELFAELLTSAYDLGSTKGTYVESLEIKIKELESENQILRELCKDLLPFKDAVITLFQERHKDNHFFELDRGAPDKADRHGWGDFCNFYFNYLNKNTNGK